MLGPIHTNPGISKTAAYFDTQIRVKGPNHSGERFQREAVSVNGFFNRVEGRFVQKNMRLQKYPNSCGRGLRMVDLGETFWFYKLLGELRRFNLTFLVLQSTD